jgi:hypothetical protein
MSRTILRVITSGLMCCAGGGAVWAHPGHGSIPPDEPAHWVEPIHAWPALAALAAVAVAVRLRSARGRS